MDTHLEHALTRLDKGALLRIEDGAGRAVAVFRGLVWITQDGDARDLIVSEGESFTLDRPGLAVVQALADSQLLLIERGDTAAETERAVAARISSQQLHARARELRAQAISDFARRLLALAARWRKRLAVGPAALQH